MTRAKWSFLWLLSVLISDPKGFILHFNKLKKSVPKIGFCCACGSYGWNTNETFPASTCDGYFLCEECAEVNDREWRMIWEDYYAGRL